METPVSNGLPEFEKVRAEYMPNISKLCDKADPSRSSGVDWGELTGIAVEMLWKAHQAWSPEGGASFWTYASHAIRNALRARIRKERSGPGVSGLPEWESVNKRVAHWEGTLGRKLHADEVKVLRETGDPRRARQLAQSWPGTTHHSAEHLPGEHEQSILSDLIERAEDAQFSQAAHRVLKGRDLEMVKLHCLGATYEQIGELVGLSTPRVGQLVPKLREKVLRAEERMPLTIPDVPEHPPIPVDRSWRPVERELEPPRYVHREGDVIAHTRECDNTKAHLVVSKNKTGSTLPFSVLCSKALGGCGASSDVIVDPTKGKKPPKPSKRTVAPKHGIKITKDVVKSIAHRPNADRDLDRIWGGHSA